jgi:hypothetical protein
VVAVFAVGFALGGAHAAVTLAIGANLIAVMSLVGAPRPSIRLAVLDALTMGVSVFAGTVTDPYLWLHTLVLAVWSFGAGLLVSFGKTQAIIGTQAIIAFVVLGRFSPLPLDALGLGVLVAAGALVEVVALLVLRLPPSLRFQRNRLADAFEALAELTLRHPSLSAIDVAATLDVAERALAAPSMFGRTDVRDLRAALDQAKRIRLELIAMAGVRARLSGTDAFSTEQAIAAILRVTQHIGDLGQSRCRPLQCRSSTSSMHSVPVSSSHSRH